VSELVFILTDLFFTTPAPTQTALPRLPQLETLFARAARTALSSDWRGWLAQRFAPNAPRAASVAATVALACDAQVHAAAPQHWLATPVHFFAGLDSVQLHPNGLLELTDAEQRRLCEDFARVFADSPWRLTAIGQRELLLSGPQLDAGGADPARFIGGDPSGGLPRGAQAATLLRLGAEIEMWLYQQPLNAERAARTQLPVSALWLWGSQLAAPRTERPALPVAPLAARLLGRDSYAEALWRLRGAAGEPLPARYTQAHRGAADDAVILYPMLNERGLALSFAQFELDWLSPALAALRAGKIDALQLLMGPALYRLRRWHLLRRWRLLRPWWESLAWG